MNTTILIIGIIVLCVLAALIFSFCLFRSGKRAVPNQNFHIPDSKARIRNARNADRDDRSIRSQKRRRYFCITVLIVAVIACAAYLTANGFLSSLVAQLHESAGTTDSEAQPAYEGNDVCIYVDGIEQAGDCWNISLSIENNSVLNLSFHALNFAINGIMTNHNLFDADYEISAGKAASLQLKLDPSVLDDFDLNDVRCVDLVLIAYDSDNRAKVFDTDQIEIRTDLYDGIHDTLGGSVIFKDDSLSVTYLDGGTDTFNFSITNCSDHYLSFSVGNLKINDCGDTISDASVQDITLLSGCETLCTLSVDQVFRQQHSISVVSSLSWQFSVLPEENASQGYETDVIRYETGLSGDTVVSADEPYSEGAAASAADPIGQFLDTDASEYYADALVWALENGITSGTSETTFSPEESCTRAQVVTFLWRAAGCPEVSYAENPFTDVGDSDAYYEPVLWALENGITSGTSESTFSPDEQITRTGITVFLWRLAGSPVPSMRASENPFQDVSENDSCLDAVLWAVENHIVSGTDSRTFSPTSPVSRAQAVTLIYRYCTNTDGSESDNP